MKKKVINKFKYFFSKEEIPEFNKEFETKLSRSHVNGHGHSHRHHIGGNTPLAIDDKKRDKKSKSKSKH